METLINNIKSIKNLVFLLVLSFLIVTIYFKNNKIDKLEKELETPIIEYVYNTTVDTINIETVTPIEVIKWKKEYITEIDTIYKPIDLTNADSLQIATAYNNLYEKYAEVKIYDDVLKNDSLAFIRLQEKTQFNSVFDRKLIYEDRTPIVYNTQFKKDNSMSIVAGLDGGADGFSIGAGAVTNKKAIYLIKYNPANKTMGGAIYLPIFNF